VKRAKESGNNNRSTDTITKSIMNIRKYQYD